MYKLRYTGIFLVFVLLLTLGIGRAAASADPAPRFAVTMTPTVVTETPVIPPATETPPTPPPLDEPTPTPTVPVPPGESPTETPRSPGRDRPTNTPTARPQLLPETGERPTPPSGGMGGPGLLAIGILIGLALGLAIRSVLSSPRIRIFSLLLVVSALILSQSSQQISALVAGYSHTRAASAGQVVSFHSRPDAAGERPAVIPAAGDFGQDLQVERKGAAAADLMPPFSDRREAVVLDDSAIQTISIPALGVTSPVEHRPLVDGVWDIRGIRDKVAWLGSTSAPGEGGNTVLAAHVNVLNLGPGPFHDLDRLQPGDRIYLYTEKNVYLYQVREGLVVKEEDVEITGPSATPQLTLVTCSDWDSKTETYLSRRVVIADLVDVRRLSSVRAGASASP